MFSLREFIKNGLLSAVGKMADYQVVLNAAGWFEKGVLVEDDLAQIQSAIDAQHAVASDESESEIEPPEETAEEITEDEPESTVDESTDAEEDV